jgi:CubicO group peptidase (beta-lactamase class C family)
MRSNALQKGVVLSFLLTSSVSSFVAPAPHGQTPTADFNANLTQKPDSSDRSSRIERVENGLLPPTVMKGETPVRMRLTDRMQFFKTPGVSVAVINNGQVEWARGYGVLEAGAMTR